MTQKKFYRPNVAAIIVSSAYPDEKQIFIAERSDLAGVWQFPQGGIDEGESPEEALFRELKEELLLGFPPQFPQGGIDEGDSPEEALL